ncbi:RNA polymerase II degradation factor 1 isoform X2 [Spodoptera litura]|uniref:RNA polymerase II degradation factor 1 isoform X2 n=1 Tax=Spodoptera litura TaxID=69820 RepID=A0A9J7DQB7_SPOLT|nr:RNA polymerase II degradation factor 1 isoform X2 [Spodoptera litura]
MSRLDNKIWLWCLLALHVGSVWGTARPVTVRTPPSNPSTIEAQAKFFQYRHLPKADEFDQGHRLGSERHFTERHERAKPSEGLFSAKVRWGDKKGGYGEHYWDLNHAGNADNIGDDGDDGSYRDSHNDDPYDEPSNNAPTYGEEEYDPERSSYEETGRAKRAHPKVDRARKSERKHPKSYQSESTEEPAPKKQNNRERNNNNREQEAAETSHEEEFEDEEEEEKTYEKPKPKRQQYRKKEDDNKQKEKNQIVLVVSHKDDEDQQQNQFVPTTQPDHSLYLNQQQPDLTQYLPQPQQLPQYLPQAPQVPKQHLEPPHFVPYEGGAGVRQHHQPDVTAASTVPRLFLEPSTGHVVDRATGQAYVLQPIAPHNNYN